MIVDIVEKKSLPFFFGLDYIISISSSIFEPLAVCESAGVLRVAIFLVALFATVFFFLRDLMLVSGEGFLFCGILWLVVLSVISKKLFTGKTCMEFNIT